jgi:hypothetical protein
MRDTLLKTIWVALAVSIVMYLLLALFMGNLARDSGGGMVRDLSTSMTQVFVALGGGCTLASIGLFAALLTPTKLEQRFAREGADLLIRSLPIYVVCWALNSTVSVIGLIWAVLARDPSRIYPFFVVAMLLQIPMFPKAGQIVRRLSAP